MQQRWFFLQTIVDIGINLRGWRINQVMPSLYAYSKRAEGGKGEGTEWPCISFAQYPHILAKWQPEREPRSQKRWNFHKKEINLSVVAWCMNTKTGPKLQYPSPRANADASISIGWRLWFLVLPKGEMKPGISKFVLVCRAKSAQTQQRDPRNLYQPMLSVTHWSFQLRNEYLMFAVSFYGSKKYFPSSVGPFELRILLASQEPTGKYRERNKAADICKIPSHCRRRLQEIWSDPVASSTNILGRVTAPFWIPMFVECKTLG